MRYIALLSVGCRYVMVSSECEMQQYPIADDETVGRLQTTPEQMLSVITGSYRFEGSYDNGMPVVGSGTIARGAGQALAFDGTIVHEDPPNNPWTRELQTQMGILCEDMFHVPIDASLTTADGALIVSLDTVAEPMVIWADGVPDGYMLRGEVDPIDLERSPTPPDPGATLVVELQWTDERADDGTIHASLWWQGEQGYIELLESADR